MKTIPLSRGYVALVDDADYEQVMAAGPWFARPEKHTVYAHRNTRRADGRHTTQALHRFLTGFVRVDHRNGDGLDNQRHNLREATAAQNAMNRRRRSDNQSGFKGVAWHRQRSCWRALIYTNGKTVNLGHFRAPEYAARAYDTAAVRLFGEFARLNFPEEHS